MSKLVLAGLIFVFSLNAFGQGQLIFVNNSPQTITNTVTGLPAAGGPAQEDTQVGLYIGDVGDSVGSLQLIGAVTNCFTPGRFNGGTRTLSGWTGTVLLQVRAWLASTVYPSYEAAVAGALAGDFSVLVGCSAPFNFALTEFPAGPNSIASAGLTPIVLGSPCPVPEPSSLALAGLVLGVLFLFHRRKQNVPISIKS
jgi:hypothetical protein